MPLHAPDLGGNCSAYAQEVLKRGDLGTGSFVSRLESVCARLCWQRHAVALSSGTAALHLGLLALGVEPGDRVLLSDLTFIAPANTLRYCQADAVFVDADGTWQMAAPLVARWLGALDERLPRVLLPVHILGGGCDMPALMAAARKYGLAVLEDASQAFGATIHGRPAGSYGDVAVLSFNANKTVGGPGGGMLLTNSKEIARRVHYLAWQARDGPGYIHHEVGYNYRMSDLQAAVILGQVERLEEILAAKRQVAQAYQETLSGLEGVSTMPIPPWVTPSWWLWSLLLPTGWRQRMQAALWAEDIESRPLWQPMHESPAHGGPCLADGTVASWLYRRALSLPSSPGLGSVGARRVAEIVRRIYLTGGKGQA